MTDVLYDRSSVLSLWRIDPYWNSQLLVEYSKDIFSCMILDDQLHEDGYSIRDGVIYYHGSIFLSIASKLKEKGYILATSSLPTLTSDFALWQEQKGNDSSLPTCIFGMGDFKEEDDHMTEIGRASCRERVSSPV